MTSGNGAAFGLARDAAHLNQRVARPDGVEQQRGQQPRADAPALIAGARDGDVDPACGASMRGVKVAVTPPWRMNVPSCTLRTRSTAGLYVTVNVIIDMRDALLIESGTVYGPPATRNSGGAVTMICAGGRWRDARAPPARRWDRAGHAGRWSRAGGVAGGAIGVTVGAGGTVPGAGARRRRSYRRDRRCGGTAAAPWRLSELGRRRRRGGHRRPRRAAAGTAASAS